MPILLFRKILFNGQEIFTFEYTPLQYNTLSHELYEAESRFDDTSAKKGWTTYTAADQRYTLQYPYCKEMTRAKVL